MNKKIILRSSSSRLLKIRVLLSLPNKQSKARLARKERRAKVKRKKRRRVLMFSRLELKLKRKIA